jgi:hypothetical protein
MLSSADYYYYYYFYFYLFIFIFLLPRGTWVPTGLEIKQCGGNDDY